MYLVNQRRSFTMNVHGFQRALLSPSSSPLIPVQLPSPMEAHFWYVLPEQVKSPSLMSQYLELLSPCEKDRVLSFRGDENKKSALLSRALVRTTVARYTNSVVDPKSLKFRKNSFGKPEVDWDAVGWQSPKLHFNISHTSSLIACGVTSDAQIGIDVEEKTRKIKSDVLVFARRYFSSHELEHLSAITDPEIQRQEFMKLWTLKEAYVKALGRGFSAAPFNTFTIRFRPGMRKGESHQSKDSDSKDGCGIADQIHAIAMEAQEIVVESFDDPNILTSNWQFALLELAGSHYAAICMERAKLNDGRRHVPMKLTVRRTIPFVEDECITGTDAVVAIGGFT